MSDLSRDIAAVDLGSNSFHTVIARQVDGELQVIDRLKEMVRLAAGLDGHKRLDEASQERALESLRRLGERLRPLPPGNVRVVGTNTLRKAQGTQGFLQACEEALGHPIEIVSGVEEARLIYLGVTQSIGRGASGRRLVVDIGGGSTEFIIGTGIEPLMCDSKYMGCVDYSARFFPEGRITPEGFERAEIAARVELQSNVRAWRALGWELAIGSSGTARAIADMLLENDIERGGITLAGMEALRRIAIARGHTDGLDIPGLSERRRPVLPGGLAILMGAFRSLGIERMVVSDGAMREGVLYELIGRIHHRDVRDRTVEQMASKHQVDLAHAARVEATALELWRQVALAWGMEAESYGRMLSWAARLHEIGLSLSHAGYHKTGSYLVERSDMPGFSRQDQKLLWAMVRSHRRSLKPHRFDRLPEPLPTTGPRLAALLRLAVLLNRSRADDAAPGVRVEASADPAASLELRFPDDFLEGSPLTRADLEEEVERLRGADIDLRFDDGRG